MRRRSGKTGTPPPVIVITGPSGAGKGTLIRALLPRVPELELAVSATTRLQRAGEEEGRDYYYLSEGDFARRVAEGEFLEHITYVSGQRYGTLRTEVERIGNEGRIPVLELETEGRAQGRRGAARRRHRLRHGAARRARAAAARARDRERG